MMTKKRVVFAGIIVGLGLGAYLFAGYERGSELPTTLIVRRPLEVNQRLVKIPIPSSRGDVTVAVVEPSQKKIARKFPFYGFGAGQDVTAVSQNPEPFVRRAKEGDGDAAVLVLSAINACYPIELRNDAQIQPATQLQGSPKPKFEECKNMIPDLAVNRLDILNEAIKKGSAEAKLMYALNARYIFFNDQFAGDMQHLYTVDQVNRIVEKYANDSAMAGYDEAFSFLAKSYYLGEFGVRDPISAVGYASALATIGKTSLGEHLLAEYSVSLTPQQKAVAAVLASTLVERCCK